MTVESGVPTVEARIRHSAGFRRSSRARARHSELPVTARLGSEHCSKQCIGEWVCCADACGYAPKQSVEISGDDGDVLEVRLSATDDLTVRCERQVLVPTAYRQQDR